LSPVVNTVPAMASSRAAVASSPGLLQSAMSPAPTSTGSPGGGGGSLPAVAETSSTTIAKAWDLTSLPI
jgi:hypothetical protein